MKEKLLCPLMSHRPFDQEHPCVKEDCAWWIMAEKEVVTGPGIIRKYTIVGCALKILAERGIR